MRVPLTDAQETLLARAREAGPGAAIGSVTSAVRVAGPLDLGILAAALRALTLRHEALRLLFLQEDHGLVVTAADERDPELAVCRAVGAGPLQRELDAGRLATAERTRPAGAMPGPPLRALVIRLDEDDHVLALSAHRLVCDLDSLRILTAELAELYAARRARRPARLSPLPLPYTRYCAWARGQWPANQPYWDKTLAGARTPSPEGDGTALHLTLPAGLAARGRAHGATVLESLAACWAAVLSEVTGTGRPLIATDLPGRCRPEHEPLVGALTQRVHLRIDTGGRPGFDALLGRVGPVVRGAAAHRFHPAHRLRSALPFPYELRWLGRRRPRTGAGLSWLPFPLPARAPGTGAPALTAEQRPDGTIAATVSGDRASAPALAERLRESASAIASAHRGHP